MFGIEYISEGMSVSNVGIEYKLRVSNVEVYKIMFMIIECKYVRD